MNYGSIANVMGKLLLVTGSSMVLPVICALCYPGEGDLFALVVSALLIVAAGFPFWWRHRHAHELTLKDGFFIAVFGWVLITIKTSV